MRGDKADMARLQVYIGGLHIINIMVSLPSETLANYVAISHAQVAECANPNTHSTEQ